MDVNDRIEARFNRIPKIRNQIQIEITARTNWMAQWRKRRRKPNRFRSHTWNMFEFWLCMFHFVSFVQLKSQIIYRWSLCVNARTKATGWMRVWMVCRCGGLIDTIWFFNSHRYDTAQRHQRTHIAIHTRCKECVFFSPGAYVASVFFVLAKSWTETVRVRTFITTDLAGECDREAKKEKEQSMKKKVSSNDTHTTGKNTELCHYTVISVIIEFMDDERKR